LRLQWGRGAEAAERSAPRPGPRGDRACFNGAAALRPRKAGFLAATFPNGTIALQWGRGAEAAERLGFSVPRARRASYASMGPRR